MIKGTTMSRANSVKHGIALMREFHSEDGLSNTTNIMLESLKEAAITTLEHKEWNANDRKIFIMVLLRTACQIGKSNHHII